MHLCPICNRRTINVLDVDDDDEFSSVPHRMSPGQKITISVLAAGSISVAYVAATVAELVAVS